MRTYTFQPVRVVVAALIFTALVIWQADLFWGWWLPAFLFIAAVFAGMHAFYNWANTRLNEMGGRAREVEDGL
jgi:CHASE2 domain-containing sensor protein